MYPAVIRLTDTSRASLIALSVAVGSLTLPANALAESAAEDAYRAYVTGLKGLGLSVEDGSVSYDAASDTLTVTDSRVSLMGAIDVPDKSGSNANAANAVKRSVDYDISVIAGSMSITGFSESDGTFSADKWTYSDDTKITASGSVTNEGRAVIEGRLNGFLASNYSFSLPELPPENPAAKASRWLPFMKTLLLSSYDEVSIKTIGMTLEAYENTDAGEAMVLSGTAQMDGYRILDAKDGFIGEYIIDSMTQSLQSQNPSGGEALNQTTRQGRTAYEGIDAGALLDLFDTSVPESTEARTLIASGSAVSYESRQDLGDGLSMTIKVGESSLQDVWIAKQENDLLGLFDTLLENKVPEPEDLITNIFQFYRSFGITDARLKDVSLSLPNPEKPNELISARIREMAMSEIDSGGIGELLLVGLDAPDLPEGVSVKLDWASIGDIEFADYGPMREMITTLIANPNYGDDHPLDVARAFTPRSFAYELEGLDVSTPEVGNIRIGKTELAMASEVPPVPTSFYSKNDDFVLPVSALDDREAQEMLTALGLTTLTWSNETRLYWDPATLELTLDQLMIDVAGLGRAEASAKFANVPQAVFEDPENQAQAALIMAQFVGAEIVFKDAGLARNGLPLVAQKEGIPENVFREAIAAQAAQATAPIQNAAFSQMVSDAVSKFLSDPQELRVTLKPAAPVPVAQILGSLAAPQTLPDLLNVFVIANEPQ